MLQGGINVNRGSDALSQMLPASRHGHEQPSSLHHGGSSSSQAPAGDPPSCGVPQSQPHREPHGIRRVRSFLPPAPSVPSVSPCGVGWIAAVLEMLRLRPSHESQVAANSDPKPRQSPRQPLHSVPAVVTGFACHPDPKEVFGGSQGPEERRALPAAEGSVYEPPAALIAAWLEKERLFERGKRRLKKRNLQPSSR